MQPVIALPPGTLLNSGRYRILRELNRGGTAVVYAAEDTRQPGNFVALKVMNGPEQVPVKVVKREIAFSAAARHNNIVQLLDVFAEKAQLVIVWELISGPDLLDLLNEHNGSLPEPMAAFFFCQLLQAAQFMHDKGYCHRDLKPENCMIQRANSQLKLIDFGLSKHLASAKTLGVGTPDYLAPEMLQVWASASNGMDCSYDARAVDAWAMGVLLFLLCTGRYPFEDPQRPNNLSVTVQNVLGGRMQPFPPQMSAGCQSLILGLLCTNPTQRTTLHAMARCDWLLKEAEKYAAAVGRTDLIAPLLLQSTASAGQQQQQQQPPPEADAAAKVLLTGGGSSSGGGSAGEAMEVDAVDERKPAEKAARRNTCCVVKGAGGAHTAVGMEGSAGAAGQQGRHGSRPPRSALQRVCGFIRKAF